MGYLRGLACRLYTAQTGAGLHFRAPRSGTTWVLEVLENALDVRRYWEPIKGLQASMAEGLLIKGGMRPTVLALDDIPRSRASCRAFLATPRRSIPVRPVRPSRRGPKTFAGSWRHSKTRGLSCCATHCPSPRRSMRWSRDPEAITVAGD